MDYGHVALQYGDDDDGRLYGDETTSPQRWVLWGGELFFDYFIFYFFIFVFSLPS